MGQPFSKAQAAALRPQYQGRVVVSVGLGCGGREVLGVTHANADVDLVVAVGAKERGLRGG